MNWEKKKLLVTVKAYPEHSKKHGDVVCTAGITEEGEMIRLYPVPVEYFTGNNRIPKYSWIEVECKKASEKLNRKESYKIRTTLTDPINILDTSMTHLNKSITDWEKRRKYIDPLVSTSVEELKEKFNVDRTSLGIIKAGDLIDFYTEKDLDELSIETSNFVQKTLFGDRKRPLDEIPHVFKYRFRCSEDCPGEHNMTVVDWELYESYRKWSDHYEDNETLWEKLYQRYYDEFKEKDLHFYMGTHSRYPTWMIIGLFYPPKRTYKRLNDF